MEETFGNILYFIPIALVITFRIINARNKNARKQEQQKKSTGELIRKIKETENDSSYSKTSESNRPHWETGEIREIKPGKQVKKSSTAVKKPAKIPPRKSAALPSHTTTADIFTQIPAAAEAKTVPAAEPQQKLQAGMTPLQQAVVWSEILGPPKGISLQ